MSNNNALNNNLQNSLNNVLNSNNGTRSQNNNIPLNSNTILSNFSLDASNIINILIFLTILGIVVILLIVFVRSYKKNKVKNVSTSKVLETHYDLNGEPEVIPNDKFPKSPVGNEYNLSFWIYINDLTYRQHQDKYILIKGNVIDDKERFQDVNPAIYIPQHSNSLRIEFKTVGQNENQETHTIKNFCELDNLPIQRWNFISLNVHNNKCDIFLDAQLKKSSHLDGLIMPNNFPMILAPLSKDTNSSLSGLDGYISSIHYTNRIMSPKEINKLFRKLPKIYRK